jgi:predicted nuclease with TOPRIM domain
MNFYSMDVYEIERYIRNNSIEASTLTTVLLDKLKEVTGKFENLKEVLYELDLSDDAQTLEDELRTVYYDWDQDQTELKMLKIENEGLRNELKLLDNLTDYQHDEIEALQNDINVLKESFAN